MEGYGFNNPNPERKKKGLPPLNFDGSNPQDDWRWVYEEFFGQFFNDLVVQPVCDATCGRIQKRIQQWYESRSPIGPIETAGPPAQLPVIDSER